jgi:hypothetical protein
MLKKIKAIHFSKASIATAVSLAVLFVLLVSLVRFNITGRFEGLFLLKRCHGKLLELKDDLYLGDGYRLIYGLNFEWAKPYRSYDKLTKNAPCLYFEWDDKDGKGFVRNFLPGGKRITTSLGRFDYAENQGNIGRGLEVHGLFVGGGLPAMVSSEETVTLNETGMAYWDGKRWYHLWCSVNEGIAPASTKVQINPSKWKFLGSKVLQESSQSIAITSAHEIDLDGHPLRMDRYAYFKAGKPYFILSIRVKNIGTEPASFYYSYGDEPWVGDFGSSAGNVGWVKDALIKRVQFVDTTKYSYAGFFDCGNDLVSSYGNFTQTANFIEWFGQNVPTVYFSNGADDYPPADGVGKVLGSDERFIGLEWGPQTLDPGQSVLYALAIGMAENDPTTGFPVKPEIRLKYMPK